MAAKQYVVVRGQIEKCKEVLAKQGEPYKPKDAAEEKRLLDAGVIAELGAPAKGKGNSKAKRSPPPPETPPGGNGDNENTNGTGTGTAGDSGGSSGGSSGDT